LNRIHIQIYEVQTPAEAARLIALGVDHVGSVVLSRENWQLPVLRETVRTVHAANARSSLIPLFSDFDAVARMLDYYRPDIVHFCETVSLDGGSPNKCDALADLQAKIKAGFPDIDIMRSIPIAPKALADQVPTLTLARTFAPVSDYFLTDTLLFNATGPDADHQPVRGFVGITGQTCDWDMAAKLVEASPIPVILAGGIGPHNVLDGILHVRPAGVDSCTGTNAVNGDGHPIRFQKDMDKVKTLVENVRKAESGLLEPG
jgi:phosphoribosylanthranilate isomerase